MNESPFYITLPSDASMEQHRENTAAEWTTKLKHSVTLKGKWEVALVEMQYVNSLSNIPTQQTMIIRTITGIREANEKGQPEFTDHAIVYPPGNYTRYPRQAPAHAGACVEYAFKAAVR